MSVLFSFRGRCGRLAYLGIFVVQMVLFLIALSVGAVGLAAGVMGSGIAGLLGVLAVVGGVIAMAWIGAAALARRTRDIGWKPVVVLPLWYVLSIVPLMVPPLALLVFPVQAVVGLILLFKGPVPYDVDDRARGHSLSDTGEDTSMDDAIAAMVAARSAQKAKAGEGAPAYRSAVTRVAKAPQASIGLSPAKRGGFGQRGAIA